MNITEAIPRIIAPEAAYPEGMFALALLGIVVNGIAVLRLKSGQSLSERMVSWHLLEDVIGWVAVLIVSIVMYFYDLSILDPILSIVITLYILFNVFGNLKQVMFTFLQGVPPEIQVKKLVAQLREIENVTQIHHTHVWSQDGEHHVMTTHAVAPKTLSPQQVNQLRKEIKKTAARLGI